jgi:hypothetical protein
MKPPVGESRRGEGAQSPRYEALNVTRNFAYFRIDLSLKVFGLRRI